MPDSHPPEGGLTAATPPSDVALKSADAAPYGPCGGPGAELELRFWRFPEKKGRVHGFKGALCA